MMKKFLGVVALVFISFSLLSQASYRDPITRAAVTVGLYNGGGSLIGVDLEFLLTKHIGVQGGVGLGSFGAGLNYHLKNGGTKSSLISLSYWHQGFKDNYIQSLVGPSFIYRSKKLFTAQIGLGAFVDYGPEFEGPKIPMMLMYSIGIYIPYL